VPDNGPYKNDQIYSFDYGNVHFIVLDSQFYEETESNPSLLQDEQTWLEQDLQKTQKEWKIAFWHKPPYSARSLITNEDVKNAFSEILDKYHVDVVFNGHDHVYSRTYPLNNDTITTTDSGTVYVITGQTGGKYYDDNMQKVWYSEYYDPQEQPIFLVIDVNGDIFNMKVYTSDETLIDNYTINKNGIDTKLPIIPPPYQNTRLVINGVLLNQPLVPVPPSLISGKWYLPVKAVVGFLGGTEIDSENDANITMKVQYYAGDGNPWSDRKNHVIVLSNSSSMASIDSQSVELPDIIIRDSKGNFLISADSFNELCGFSWRYDANRNELLLINPNSFS